MRPWTSRHQRLAGLVAVASAFAVAANAASAATLSVSRPCYVITRTAPPMMITGTGFVPGSAVLVTSSLNIDVSATANSSGDISATTQAPAPRFSTPSVKVFTVTAQDQTPKPQITASTKARVAPLGVSHGGTAKAPGLEALHEVTSWTFSGFTPGATIYAHYVLGGQQVALHAFGKARGDCGLLHSRAPLYPATPHHASYPVQFDTVRRYLKKTEPRILGRVSLKLAF